MFESSKRLGYNKPIEYSPDSDGAVEAIRDLNYEMRNPYNDGFTQSDMKQKLLRIRIEVNKALADAPRFTGEDDD
jgi:hypothetical protein